MTLKDWYWIILAVWVIFGGVSLWWDDVRVRRGGTIVLIILLILLGLLVPGGGPVKP